MRYKIEQFILFFVDYYEFLTFEVTYEEYREIMNSEDGGFIRLGFIEIIKDFFNKINESSDSFSGKIIMKSLCIIFIFFL